MDTFPIETHFTLGTKHSGIGLVVLASTAKSAFYASAPSERDLGNAFEVDAPPIAAIMPIEDDYRPR